jgi:hypothetical protein
MEGVKIVPAGLVLNALSISDAVMGIPIFSPVFVFVFVFVFMLSVIYFPRAEPRRLYN